MRFRSIDCKNRLTFRGGVLQWYCYYSGSAETELKTAEFEQGTDGLLDILWRETHLYIAHGSNSAELKIRR